MRWRRGRDSLSPAGSVRVGSDSPLDCHSLPTRSNPLIYQRKKRTPAGVLCVGGEEGIRTLVGLPPNGFQDRLVMTASIPLHRKIFHRCMCCVARRGSPFLAPHTAANLFRLYYTMKQKCLLAMAFLRSRQYMRYAQAYKGEAERLASQGFYAYIIPYFPAGSKRFFLFSRGFLFSP